MFTFTVKPDGGETFTVTATTRDVLIWEKADPKRSFADFTRGVSLEDMYTLAHTAARRQNLYPGTLAEFETSVDLEFEQEVEAEDPTPPVPSTA